MGRMTYLYVQVTREMLDHQANLESTPRLDHQARRDHQDHLENLDPLDHREIPEHQPSMRCALIVDGL